MGSIPLSSSASTAGSTTGMGHMATTAANSSASSSHGLSTTEIYTAIGEAVKYGNTKWLHYEPYYINHLLGFLVTPNEEEPVFLRRALSYYHALEHFSLNKMYMYSAAGDHFVLLSTTPLYIAATMLRLRQDKSNLGLVPLRLSAPTGDTLLEYCARELTTPAGQAALTLLSKVLTVQDDHLDKMQILAHVGGVKYPHGQRLSEAQVAVCIAADSYHELSNTPSSCPIAKLLIARWRELAEKAPHYSTVLREQLRPLVEHMRSMDLFVNLRSEDYQWLTENGWKGFEGWDKFTVLQRRLAILNPYQLWYLSGLPFTKYQESAFIQELLRDKLSSVDITDWVKQRTSDAERTFDDDPTFFPPCEVSGEDNTMCNRHDSYGPFDRHMIYNKTGSHCYYFTREEFKTLVDTKHNFYTRERIGDHDSLLLEGKLLIVEKYNLPAARPLQELWDDMLSLDGRPHPFTPDSKGIAGWHQKHRRTGTAAATSSSASSSGNVNADIHATLAREFGVGQHGQNSFSSEGMNTITATAMNMLPGVLQMIPIDQIRDLERSVIQARNSQQQASQQVPAPTSTSANEHALPENIAQQALLQGFMQMSTQVPLQTVVSVSQEPAPPGTDQAQQQALQMALRQYAGQHAYQANQQALQHQELQQALQRYGLFREQQGHTSDEGIRQELQQGLVALQQGLAVLQQGQQQAPSVPSEAWRGANPVPARGGSVQPQTSVASRPVPPELVDDTVVSLPSAPDLD